MARFFWGGIHPDGKKNATRHLPIEVLPAPEQVILPLLRAGVLCSSSARKGDRVFPGQIIASAPGTCSPIRASVSGAVLAVEARPHPGGPDVPSIVIQNDFRESGAPRSVPDPDAMSPEELAERIQSAGVAGPGGSAFFSKGDVDTLIVDGTEGQPYITREHRLMLEYPDDILAGTRYLMKALGLHQAFIAIQGNKLDAIDLLRRRLSIKHSDITVLSLRTRYPQGSSRLLTQAVTGRQVAPGAGPESVGCFITGADTVWDICAALRRGAPAVRRVITVAGPGVHRPKNLDVPVGTPISNLLAAAGGLRDSPHRIILGGPMTGTALKHTSAPVLWDTEAVLVLDLPKPEPEDPVCIRCGKCAAVCPMHLLPLYLYAGCRQGDDAELRELNLADCIECGACAYICPGRLPLTRTLGAEKRRLFPPEGRN